MGRSPCCDENGLKKGPWTTEEDQKLKEHIEKHGHGSWRALPKLAGLNRCGKSCRLRWTNYLRPDIKRGKFSQDEEQTILHLHSILGNKWSAIATHLPGRTDNEIKNFWNTHLKKKLIQMGFDPMTHQPRTDLFASLPHLIALLNLKELMENHPQLDEHALILQAEATQLAKIQYFQCLLQSSPPPISSTNPFSSNANLTCTEMDLLKAYFDSSLNPQSNTSFGNISLSQPLQHQPDAADPLLLSHLSDPQVPFSYPPPLNSDDQMGQVDQIPSSCLVEMISQVEFNNSNKNNIYNDNDNDNDNSPSDHDHSSWVLEQFQGTTPPALVEISMSNPGDASSTTSSYGGGASSYNWPQLFFEDPLLIS